MLHGPDGKIVIRMTWKHFEEYQRWDEFPEYADSPPMTTDFAFWYKKNKFYCTGEESGYVIVDEIWNRLAYSENFLQLLEMPIFNGKSFRDSINEILFVA